MAQQRFSLYLTDREMADYFSNPTNGLDQLFNLPGGQQIRFGPEQLQHLAKTLKERVRDAHQSLTLVGFFSRELLGDNWVRVYLVE